MIQHPRAFKTTNQFAFGKISTRVVHQNLEVRMVAQKFFGKRAGTDAGVELYDELHTVVTYDNTMNGYNAENLRDVMTRLKEFEPYLRPLYMDETTRLYEIVGFPP